MTKDELAAASGLGYHEYDTALPQDWVEDVKRVTQEWAPRYAIVWSYKPYPDGRPNFVGRPLALDPEAKTLLEEYEGRTR